MPAVSKKQQRFFGYLLSNPEERKKKGISKKAAKDFASDVQEVAPPGWGHTKAEKEKTKPDKPKSKIGGSAAAFKRALDDGRFKGLPGDKTYKDKKESMFKLMWSMKKKGSKPHYKPGTDEKYKKYQEEEVVLEKDLNAAERRALPDSDFALPGKGEGPKGKQAGSYPIPDEKHARSALSLVAQHGTPAEKATVRAKVKKKFPNIEQNEDWKPEIEVIDTKKEAKKREKKRKEAESSLPPHLRLDTMKKAFAHTNESAVLDANTKISTDVKKKKKEEELRRLLKHAIAVKRGQAESFEIDKAAHKKVQKKAKLRNLAKGNMNPNEKAAAEKKAGGPKLAFEGWQERAKEAMKKVVGKKKEEKKASMDSTTSKIHDLRKEKFKSEKQKEHEKYVNFLDADD